MHIRTHTHTSLDAGLAWNGVDWGDTARVGVVGVLTSDKLAAGLTADAGDWLVGTITGRLEDTASYSRRENFSVQCRL